MQSPDGSRYAFAAADGIHDVDLRSGVDRKLVLSTPNQVVEYGADGIYVTKYGAYSGHLGLWLLNPLTAGLKQLLPVSVAFDELEEARHGTATLEAMVGHRPTSCTESTSALDRGPFGSKRPTLGRFISELTRPETP